MHRDRSNPVLICCVLGKSCVRDAWWVDGRCTVGVVMKRYVGQTITHTNINAPEHHDCVDPSAQPQCMQHDVLVLSLCYEL